MQSIVLIMIAHWVGDFVCQTRYVAENKSKHLDVLWIHCIEYGWVIGLALWLFGGYNYEQATFYAIANLMIHFCVDFCTSRLSGYFYLKGKIWAFFTTVGFDQLLHFISLYYTTQLLEDIYV